LAKASGKAKTKVKALVPIICPLEGEAAELLGKWHGHKEGYKTTVTSDNSFPFCRFPHLLNKELESDPWDQKCEIHPSSSTQNKFR
jgi:hypothetical protein